MTILPQKPTFENCNSRFEKVMCVLRVRHVGLRTSAPTYRLPFLIRVAISLRFRHGQGTFVNRATGNRTANTFMRLGFKGNDILHIGHAAGGDNWDARGLRHSHSGLHIYALHHAVAGDIGVDDTAYAVLLEALS